MGSTDGLVRGLEIEDTLAPIMVPVGEETLGEKTGGLLVRDSCSVLQPHGKKNTYKEY